ncbi:hypothetical protein BDU57DRAFT_115141 [Ampelomyces quisqualis]|uniref:Uncharacterized protein n=1 Tax=Ampelomyces quisqualis TaxID=50730 RepID=A0A6A5Q4N3_AMPQU|nr:hypothetical protein BDU57DRAFT_115141 [Ampelomyces quisqualis]
MGPRTNALAGRGRKPASRCSQTRASEAASVTPAPLGILTATPRKSVRRIASQEEQDAVRRLIEESCEGPTTSCNPPHQHRDASRKDKEKVVHISNSPSSKPSPPHNSDHAFLPLPVPDHPADQQVSGSSPSGGRPAPTSTRDQRGIRSDAPTPSSLGSVSEAGPVYQKPTPFQPSSLLSSDAIRPTSTSRNNPLRASNPRGEQVLSPNNGRAPLSSSTYGSDVGSSGLDLQQQPRSDVARAGHKHTLSNSSLGHDHNDNIPLRKKPSLTLNDMDLINKSNEETIHTALRDFGALFGPQIISSLEARLDQSEAAAHARHIRTYGSLASLRAASQVDVTHLLEMAQKGFGHLRRRQDSELSDARHERDAAQRMLAEYRQQLLISEARLQVSSTDRDEASRLLDGVATLAEQSHTSCQNFRDSLHQSAQTRQTLSQSHTSNLIEQQGKLQTQLGRAERERDEAQRDCNQMIGLAKRTQEAVANTQHQSQQMAQARRSLFEMHNTEVTERDREQTTRLSNAERHLNKSRQGRNQIIGFSEHVQGEAAHVQSRTRQAEEIRQSLADTHNTQDLEREQERDRHLRALERDRTEAQQERNQAIGFSEQTQTASVDSQHQTQLASETRQSLSQTHNAQNTERENEQHSSMRYLQQDQNEAQVQREHEHLLSLSDHVQTSVASTQRGSQQAAQARQLLAETHNTGLLGRMTAMVFGRRRHVNDAVHTAEQERDQAIRHSAQLNSSSSSARHRAHEAAESRQSLHRIHDAGMSAGIAARKETLSSETGTPSDFAQVEMLHGARELDRRALTWEREVNAAVGILRDRDIANRGAQLGQAQDLRAQYMNSEQRARSADTNLANVLSLSETGMPGISASAGGRSTARILLHNRDTVELREQLARGNTARVDEGDMTGAVEHQQTLTTATSLFQSADSARGRVAQTQETRNTLSSVHMSNLQFHPSTSVSTASPLASLSAAATQVQFATSRLQHADTATNRTAQASETRAALMARHITESRSSIPTSSLSSTSGPSSSAASGQNQAAAQLARATEVSSEREDAAAAQRIELQGLSNYVASEAARAGTESAARPWKKIQRSLENVVGGLGWGDEGCEEEEVEGMD